MILRLMILTLSLWALAAWAEVKVTTVTNGNKAVVTPVPSQAPSGRILSLGKKPGMIVISQGEKQRWKLREQVCVTRNQKELSCGHIVMTTEKDATVQLTSTLPVNPPRSKVKAKPVTPVTPQALTADLRTGDEVVVKNDGGSAQNFNITVNITQPEGKPSVNVAPAEAKPKGITPAEENLAPPREPAATKVTAATTNERIPSRASNAFIGLGIAAGLDYAFPIGVLQFAVSQRLAIGLSPVFFSTHDGSVARKAYGGFLTLGAYFTQPAFNGLYGEVGGGAYAIKNVGGTIDESATVPAASFLLGWRSALTAVPITVGGALGGQWISKSSNLVLTSFHGVLPLFRLEAGYVF